MTTKKTATPKTSKKTPAKKTPAKKEMAPAAPETPARVIPSLAQRLKQPSREITSKAKNKEGVWVDTLSCGHDFVRPSNWCRKDRFDSAGDSTRRRCQECPPETKKEKAERKASEKAAAAPAPAAAKEAKAKTSSSKSAKGKKRPALKERPAAARKVA